jgi:chaperone BCS1
MYQTLDPTLYVFAIRCLVTGMINGQAGLNPSYLVWAIALCVPVRKYGSETFTWLSDNVTNSLQLDRYDALTTDLLIWISKQPSN